MAKNPPQTDEEKAAERVRRAERRAARKRAKENAEQALLARRREQLATAFAAENRLFGALREVRRRQSVRDNLYDHATGFYQEVNKLAKGKGPVRVTDLVIEQANQILRDARALIQDDPFLGRIKEFVRTGDSPVYSDLVVTIRSVLQALGRAEAHLAIRKDTIKRARSETLTIRAALHAFIEEDIHAAKRDVKRILQTDDVVGGWFVRTPTGNHFDFDRLDALDLEAHFSGDDGAA